MSDAQRDLDGIGQAEHPRARRVGPLILTLILLAALAGLIGPGPLSWTSAVDDAGLVGLQYSRFIRNIAATNLQVAVRSDPAQPRSARLWISSEYLTGINVQQITPQPDTSTAVNGGSVLEFPVSGPAETVTVQIQLQSNQIGLLRGQIGAPDREPIRFWQFVYP